MDGNFIFAAILLAGIAQIALVIGSLVIPLVLNRKADLAKVQLLIKQMFLTYAAYILFINFCFGLLSVFAANELLNGSLLSLLICGFIAVYWILTVYLHFDSASFPRVKLYTTGEAALAGLFIYLSIVYSLAFYFNCKLR